MYICREGDPGGPGDGCCQCGISRPLTHDPPITLPGNYCSTHTVMTPSKGNTLSVSLQFEPLADLFLTLGIAHI